MKYMKKWIAILSILAMMTGLTACGAAQPEPAASAETTAPAETTAAPETEPADENELPRLEDPELLQKIDEQCNMFFEVKELKGMSVAILSGGKIAYLNYGEKNDAGDPVDENTIYEIASLTKTFTGTLFGYSINDGSVGKDDLVQDYFDCEVPRYHGEQDMTLLQLATHTSGLPRVATNFPSSNNPYGDYTLEMLREYLVKGQLRHEPGTTYEYSNLGVAILGYILGQVNGKPYDELLHDIVLEPIGMDSSAIFLNEEQQSRKASPYLENGSPAYEWDFDIMQACGGLKSSTRDLIRYLAANLNDLETNVELAEAMATARRIYFSGDAQVGLCWHDANYSGVHAWAHDGLVGGYCSFNAFSPEEDVAVAILCNNASSVTTLGVDLMKTLAASN